MAGVYGKVGEECGLEGEGARGDGGQGEGVAEGGFCWAFAGDGVGAVVGMREGDEMR